jgi:hypothetical protein
VSDSKVCRQPPVVIFLQQRLIARISKATNNAESRLAAGSKMQREPSAFAPDLKGGTTLLGQVLDHV